MSDQLVCANRTLRIANSGPRVSRWKARLLPDANRNIGTPPARVPAARSRAPWVRMARKHHPRAEHILNPPSYGRRGGEGAPQNANGTRHFADFAKTASGACGAAVSHSAFPTRFAAPAAPRPPTFPIPPPPMLSLERRRSGEGKMRRRRHRRRRIPPPPQRANERHAGCKEKPGNRLI
eukprot:gene5194-biopygen20673